MVSFSALSTGRLYPPRYIPSTPSSQKLSRLQVPSTAGRIMSIKNSNDTFGNRIRHLPSCSVDHNQLCYHYVSINHSFMSTELNVYKINTLSTTHTKLRQFLLRYNFSCVQNQTRLYLHLTGCKLSVGRARRRLWGRDNATPQHLTLPSVALLAASSLSTNCTSQCIMFRNTSCPLRNLMV